MEPDTPTTLAATPLSPRRVGLLLLVLAVGLTAIFVRTLYLQSVKSRTLGRSAQLQQQNTQELPAVRGDIVDRNGQELAVGEQALTFYATPKLVKDPVATSVHVASILRLTEGQKEGLLTRLQNDASGFQYVARQVPVRCDTRHKNAFGCAQELVDAVRATHVVNGKIKPLYPDLQGIGWYQEERRLYPLQSVGAQLLGTAVYDQQLPSGKVREGFHGAAGLEMLYDNSLSGTPGKQVVVRDPVGTPVDVLALQQEVDGRDVHLTIDATIQTEAERVITETMKKFDARGATALVMDPKTGEILAMASVPAIDANTYGNSNPDWQRNRAVTDTYEPGSTFKVVTISAALEEGLVTPSTSFLLPPELHVADRKIHDAESRGTERMTVKDILVRSSNIGTVTIGMQLGKHRLSDWIHRYGFGRPTGIDFPGEVQGLVPNVDDPNQWSGSTIGNVPMGQGVGVTAIQLASAYAAIANDGVLVQPHLLKSIDGEAAARYPRRRVISPRTAQIMRQMFGQVVADERGTGTLARIPGYAVAGKTGTANKAEHGVYVKGKYVSSFVGFVPARNPQLLTMVMVDEPNVPWGGSVAAPAFQQITEFALQYLAIPPDGVM